jgi:ankyrin repeat protein
MKKLFTIISVLILILALGRCVQMNTMERPAQLQIRDVKIWNGTPVQKLASAVNNQNVKQIEKLTKEHHDIINYQEPQFGMTLLLWSVGMEKYEAAKALLECGADPNIIGIWEGGTALYRAAGYSFIDNEAKKDEKYVKLLLEYGADPNIGFIGNDHNTIDEIGTTPLMKSIGCGIEKTKALVETGADINYRSPTGATASIMALDVGGPNTTFETMLYAHYLIAEKGSKVTEPYSIFLGYGSSDDTSIRYPVEILKNWIPRLNSEGYKLKMEIVEEFARQGADYWATEIPKSRLEQIQKLYPDTWQEYIEKY